MSAAQIERLQEHLQRLRLFKSLFEAPHEDSRCFGPSSRPP